MLSIVPPDTKLVRITKIPINIVDNPKILNGIARFPTESFNTDLGTFRTQTSLKKNTIYYKSYGEKQEEENEEERRKKDVEVVEASIKCRRIKNRIFKLQMPVIRGPKSLKNSKANELYFTLTFNNYQGTLTLLTGMYDMKNEVARKIEMSFAQKMQKQSAMIDNRRKDDLKSMKKKRVVQSDQEQQFSQ